MKNKPELMDDGNIIGVDLGGTQVRAGVVNEGHTGKMTVGEVPSSGTVEDVLGVIYQHIENVIATDIRAIGIGVPSVVDPDRGIVYNVQNIPSWKEVHLKDLLEKRFHIPALVNNDTNCFVLGEKYFGQGKDAHSFVGLSIGTGISGGIIINDRLYTGHNCGSGEFGEAKYLDHNYEYYASGQFFKNCYKTSGKEIYKRAAAGDSGAQHIFSEFGTHLGNLIKMILFTYDPGLIIIGGSIKDAFRFYQTSMYAAMQSFTYPKSLERLKILVSDLNNPGVLGAAALYYDQQQR